MTEKENNLMVYLKKQMEEYQEECESNKALYADLLEHIEECRDQIRKLKEMEDPGFALLSPLAKEEKENAEMIRLEEQITGYEKQKQKYLHEIKFYEEKVSEMQEQLDKFADNEAKNQAWKKKLEEENAELVAAARAAESAESEPEASFSEEEASPDEEAYDEDDADEADESAYGRDAADEEEPDAEDNAFESREQIKEAYDMILRKLTEIKGYAHLDPRRCKIELESLIEYVKEKKMQTEESSLRFERNPRD